MPRITQAQAVFDSTGQERTLLQRRKDVRGFDARSANKNIGSAVAHTYAWLISAGKALRGDGGQRLVHL
jgi:hypothetical protein